VRKDIEPSERPSRDGTPTTHPDAPVNRANP
jgi:hypothetical protein